MQVGLRDLDSRFTRWRDPLPRPGFATVRRYNRISRTQLCVVRASGRVSQRGKRDSHRLQLRFEVSGGDRTDGKPVFEVAQTDCHRGVTGFVTGTGAGGVGSASE